jgi:rhamnulokinase
VSAGRRSNGTLIAIDLGASSGRVVAGRVGEATLELAEIHRFPNEPVARPDGLHWDAAALRREVIEGLRLAAAAADDIVSIGVDTWGVDYGLVDADGVLVDDPFHYRDERSTRGMAAVHEAIGQEALYARTGVQILPVNTIYQLAAARGTAELERASTMLLIPDLVGSWLCGARVAEATNASTTGLFDLVGGEWMTDLVEELGLPARILPPIRHAGEPLGPLLDDVRSATGIAADARVTLVGSHDTASAVVAVPAEGDDAAWISCGTWGLVGIEVDAPIRTEASRLANFTNEGGVDGRVRFLHNVTGLWLLQESIRTWELGGTRVELDELLRAAATLPDGGPRIDPDDPAFFPPGDMPSRIATEVARSEGADVANRLDGREPAGRAALVRCILDSLAAAFADRVAEAARLSGRNVRVIHIVGGGSRNEPLCQLTADASGLPVVAGPVEATSIGNLLVQARAHGLIEGDLSSLRALVRATQPLRRHEPRSGRMRR